MMTGSFLAKELEHTERLFQLFKSNCRQEARLEWLESYPLVQTFLQTQPKLKALITSLPQREQGIILMLIALGQGDALFQGWETLQNPSKALHQLAQSLKPLQKYYSSIGGLIGYQLIVLKLLQKQKSPFVAQKLIQPEGVHLENDPLVVGKLVRYGLEALPRLGEVYPVGGAADRMNLLDEKSQEPLPQARLKFNQKTLLEGLIRDLQGREYLYTKLTGFKTITPVAMMTSPEKRNHTHIQEILEEAHWFNRPKELFFLFEQPLVPMISHEGIFATKGPMELAMKPGGHGIIWQLMYSYGVFDWFENLKRDKLLIRQINNPLAGLDTNLLALFGKGCCDHKAFGFLSCPRYVGASEGMNVVLTTKNEDGFRSVITNVEYTDFHMRGIEDRPEKPGSPFSTFPANTNILFADIQEIKQTLVHHPLPGMLINFKGEVTCRHKGGHIATAAGGRLETTMQNIADGLSDRSTAHPTPQEIAHFRTFILFNDRCKTLSVTKKLWQPGQPLTDTPAGAWLDLQKNWYTLFTQQMGFKLPHPGDPFDPTFVIHLHPALGPLWSVMAQKIQGGELKKGAELQLEIAELCLENLYLDGSLLIESPTLQGKARLKNIRLKNQGFSADKSDFTKGDIFRTESVKITLHGSAEFVAEDLTLEGTHHFEVPDSHRLELFMEQGVLKSHLAKLTLPPLCPPSWQWHYRFGPDNFPVLTFNG